MSTATFSVFADENAGEAVTGGDGTAESAVGGSSDTGEPISPKEPETTAPSDDGGNAGETADSDVTDIQPPLDGETAGTEGDLAADQPGEEESEVEINEENFPDAHFRYYVSALFDQDNSGVLSKKELDSVTRIDYGWYPYVSTPLKGIEYFTELKELTLQVRYIWSQVSVSQVSLDLGGNTKLENLTISGGPITSLDLSKNIKLESLTISGAPITSLDVSNNTALTTLDCSGSPLTSLDVSNNTALTTLYCSGNQLTSLDVSKNTALTSLDCSNNQLTSLDVSKNTALTTLYCSGNQLTNLDVSNNTQLQRLLCSGNKLAALDLSQNKSLGILNLNGQRITLAASLADGNYQVDMTDAVGAENLDKVSITDQNCSYDPETGIVTLGDALEEFVYGYNTGAANQYQSSAIMTVTVLPKSEGAPVSYVEINEENFPDANFRSYVSAQFDQDKSGVLSKKELDSVTRIDNWYTNGITSLKGIEYFTELSYLYISYQPKLTSLDLSKNIKLESLTISGAPITSLDLSKNTALTYLNYSSCPQLTNLIVNKENLLFLGCANNNLTSLDLSQYPNLEGLNCSNNQLTSLDVSNNTALTSLNCYGNQLTSLDVSQHTKLRSLSCSDNLLSSLDVSNNTALTTLNCSGNQLTSLDVSNNIELTYLDCGINILYSTVVGEKVPKGNHLTSLDVSKNTALTTLYCSGNRLTSLDVSKNTALTTLYCSNNQLTSLDVSKNTALTVLDCSYNQLSALDLSSNTHLNQLNCSYNRITRLEVSQNGFYGYQFVTAQFFTAPASLVDGVWQADMSGILGDEKDSFELYGSTDSYRYENGILYLGSDINPRQILLYKVLDSNNRRALELYISAQMVSENLIDRVEVSNAAIACYIGDKPTASATVPSGANYKIIREVWTEYEGFNLTYPVAYWYSDGNYPEGVKTFTEFSAGKRYSYQIILQADDGWNFADPSYYYDENNIQTSDLTVVLNGSYLPERASLYINTLTITNSYVSAGYKITDGANSSWTQNSDAELSFTSNGNRSRLQYVTVDGAVLTAEQFSVASDSSVITLKKEFLDTLSAGEHMLQIVFADGNAYTVFTINPPYNPPAEHQHFFTWQYNSGSHWQVCLECGAVLAPSSHQFMGNICAVCGYIAPYTQLTASQTPGANVKIEIVDEDGFPVSDLSVELRSLPKYATTNAYGIATFNGVEFGTHTINILDSLGRILASKSFSLIPGSSFSISKDAVIAEQNSTIALSLVYSGNELTLAEDDNSVFVDIPTEVRIVKEDNEIVAD